VYEQGVARWERTGGREGIEPVPELIDADLAAIQLADVLGVPAPHLAAYPLHWLGAARVKLRAEALAAERARKRQARQRPTPLPGRSR